MIKGEYYVVTGPFKEKFTGNSFYLIEQDEALTIDNEFIEGKELVSVDDFKANMSDKESGWEEMKTSPYGGLHYDLNKLPIGQKFRVANGNWLGKIAVRDGVKGVDVGNGYRFIPFIDGQCPDLYINLIQTK